MGFSISSIPLFLLSLTFIFAVSFVPCRAKLPENRPIYDYTHVCDAQRFGKLGLEMASFPYCDKSLPYDVRAKSLVDSMTLQEKVQQLGRKASSIKRIGIPAYNWWSEALHGVSDVGEGSSFVGPTIKAATSFPTPITSGAAFNASMWKALGEAISTEARAMHNLGVAGLTFWSPNINVVRDPRWGRIMETPGEDPYAVGEYAVNFVRGLQDVHGVETPKDLNTRPLKVSACCKHYAAYDIDYWTTTGGFYVERQHYNANVTARDMVESFLRPFEMCVKDGDVSSVMCSYNNVNGVPTCADSKLLRGTVREDWNLHGYIVSDCDSIESIVKMQKFLDDTPEDGVAQAMIAGLDMDCGEYYPNFLESAIKRGLIGESDIDRALINNYMVLLRLGWFDKIKVYESLGASDVCTKENIELAVDAARQGMVLLKNRDNVLPLSSEKHKKIAVVGPHAHATGDMIGNYAGTPCRYVSPIKGLGKYAEVDYKMGCADVKCYTQTYVFPAVRAAKYADATIIVVGLNQHYEKETLDRIDLELPGYQNELIRQTATMAKGPVVLVILSAGGVNISNYLKQGSDEHLIDAIIWAGYPGQEGGQAIADVIYGKYNPGGRLPVTWYPSEYVWRLPMTSMQFRPNDELGYPGRTYKFYNESTIFPFGFGLSYTEFTYTFVSTQKMVTKKLGVGRHCHGVHYEESAYEPPCQAALVSDLNCANDIVIEVLVSNVGKKDGSDVVMLYSKAPDGLVGAPIKQLVGFQRVFLKAGASKTVKFELSSCRSMHFVTETAYEVVPAGEHVFMVGGERLPFQVYLDKEN